MNNLIGVQVYCKRDGSQGRVTAEDLAAGTKSIEVSGRVKVVTNATFKRWYTLIPEDNPESIVETISKPKADETKSERTTISGEPGIGLQLRDRFVALVKENDLERVEIFVNGEKHTDTIKFNSKNVFECSYAKNRFNVLCHPDSLSPDNRKRVTKMCPKEWGWSLRAKFVFHTLEETPLMKSIISDGLYFRKSDGGES